MTGKKIKVCHVVSCLEVGGMENGVVNLCNGHDRSCIEPMICCLKRTGPMSKRLRPDVKVVCLDFPEGRSLLRPWRVAQLFRQERPDVVHTHGWGGGAWDGVVAARLAGCPVVINGEHGLLFTGWHQLLLQRVMVQLCSQVFSVSHALKERVVQTLGIPAGSIKVITNGVDPEKFRRSADTARSNESPGGRVTGAATTVIASIGSLKPEKNQLLVLKAVKGLVAEGLAGEFRLLLVGDGPDRERLADYVTRERLQDRVSFLGKRDDVARILAGTDIFVSTSNSKHEGLSNVILEAMACAVPVVATRSVGTEEIVADGRTGFLVDAEDLDSLTAKIAYLVREKEAARRFGEEGRRTVLERYSIDRMVADYEEEYRRLHRQSVREGR